MKKDKAKSFVLYGDYQSQFDMMSDADAGILIKAIFEYVNTGTVRALPPVLEMAFSFIRSGLDRNAAKYEDICERRREYGRRGGVAKATNSKHAVANAAYSDNDSENDSDSDNGSDSESDIKGVPGGTRADKPPRSRFIPPTVEEVKAYCQERRNDVDPQRFVDFYETKGWMVGKNKMKDWRAAVRTWEKRDGGSNQQKGEEDAGKYAGLVV